MNITIYEGTHPVDATSLLTDTQFIEWYHDNVKRVYEKKRSVICSACHIPITSPGQLRITDLSLLQAIAPSDLGDCFYHAPCYEEKIRDIAKDIPNELSYKNLEFHLRVIRVLKIVE